MSKFLKFLLIALVVQNLSIAIASKKQISNSNKIQNIADIIQKRNVKNAPKVNKTNNNNSKDKEDRPGDIKIGSHRGKKI